MNNHNSKTAQHPEKALDWDDEIAGHPSFLQSQEWGKMQEKLGRKIFRFGIPGFHAMGIKQALPFGKNYVYFPHGPAVGGEAAPDSWEKLKKEICGTDGGKPVFLRAEPLAGKFCGKPIENALREAGFRPAKPVQPQTTLVIDLGKSEKEILENMEHDTRYSVRAAEKRGVSVDFFSGKEKENHFGVFWKIFSETNRRHGLKSHSEAYYKGVVEMDGKCFSKIAVAKTNAGEPVSAAIFVYFGERAFYLFAGSLSGYGKLNAPTYLLWQAIRDAKAGGFRYFDFWGISGENKKWAGITAFKKSFGGYEVRTPGAWDYVFNKPAYLIYKIIKFVRR